MADSELDNYQQVADELERNDVDKALWTKAFAESGGQDSATKAMYIKLRVEILIKQAVARAATSTSHPANQPSSPIPEEPTQPSASPPKSTLYDVIGVPVTASHTEILKACDNKLSEVIASGGENEKEIILVNHVREVLGNSEKRFAYDRRVEVDDAVAPVHIPNFGNVLSKWWGEIPRVKPLPKQFEWLYQQNTLLVFEKHLALVRGNGGKRGGASLLVDASPILGLVGAFAGIALGAAIIAKDKISNKNTNTNQEVTRDLFNSGDLIWCRKATATIWQLQRKQYRIGWKIPPISALSCVFNTLAGEMNVLFPLTSSQDTLIKDPIELLGCKIIVKATGLEEDEEKEAFQNLFKNYNFGLVANQANSGMKYNFE